MSQAKPEIRNLKSFLKDLTSKDGETRQFARIALVDMGKPAVPPLIEVLRNSKQTQDRWEAAKILGEIRDPRALPVLIAALEDADHDVTWLAAEALKRYKKLAWQPLFRALLKKGSGSALLRHGAHHVLQYQKEAGFNDLLTILRRALEGSTETDSTPVAAYDMLARIRVKA